MYQHVGLKPEAHQWIKENCVMEVDSKCPECGHIISTSPKVVSSEDIDMFYGDGPSSETFELNSGEGTVKSVLQAAPWSSGPMGFLCLEIVKGPKKTKRNIERMFEWTEDEINEML